MTLPFKATEIRRVFLAGEASAEEICRWFLGRIERTDSTLGAWITVDSEGALRAARELDGRRSRGERLGALAGIPVGVKDQIITKGIRTTAGSRILERFVPTYDAHVVERLRAEDAVILGKTNQDEFAMGSSNEHSAYGHCVNPWNPDYVPGGSSGGSAAAVAAGQVPLAVGTDTGGSVRLPAAFCGLVGLRPTYGRVSRFGLVPFASSMDQAGPLAANVADAALLFQVMAGADLRDATTASVAVPDVTLMPERGVQGLRVGVVRAFSDPGDAAGVSLEVTGALRSTCGLLRELGATVCEVELPLLECAVPAYCVLAAAEASSNLARYDGLRIGVPGAVARSLEEQYSQVRSSGFGAEVTRRILLGTFVLQSGYYEHYYGQADRVRHLMRQAFAEVFRCCDLVLLPSAPVPGFRFGECMAEPVTMYQMDLMTVPASLAGLPAMVQPVGISAQGLPLSVQWMAPAFEEALLVRACAAVEGVAGFVGRRPPEAPWGAGMPLPAGTVEGVGHAAG